MPRAAKTALLVLLAAWAAAMVWIPAVDYAWTARLTEHRHDPLAGFARRTMFQGQPPGATDLSSLLALATLAAYVLACSRRAARRLSALRTLRPTIGFLLVAAFVAGLAVVHALKTILGRARPLDVLSRGHLPFTPWYRTGNLPLAGGFWRGSFPSGHTAAVFVLLALAYSLVFDPAATRRARLVGAGVMALTATGATYMAVTSAMGGNHWLSDGLGAMGLVWILVHLLYFKLLDVPAQRRRLLASRDDALHPSLPRAWEARLCGDALLVLAGASLLLLALRAGLEERPPHPTLIGLLALSGAGLSTLGLPRAVRLLRRLHAGLDAAAADESRTEV
jgi:membrane-associated PAP2 superfamily phosphatase